MTARKARPLITDPAAVTTRFGAANAWTAHIHATLADGRTHDVDEILATAATLVPEPRAMRHMSAQLEAQRRTDGHDRVYLTATGQRRVASQALQSVERAGLAIRDTTADTVTAAPAFVTAYQAWARTR
jgi:hypothetical protein